MRQLHGFRPRCALVAGARLISRGRTVCLTLCLLTLVDIVIGQPARAVSVGADINANNSAHPTADVNASSSNGSRIQRQLPAPFDGSFFADPGTGQLFLGGTSTLVSFGATPPDIVSSSISGEVGIAETLTTQGNLPTSGIIRAASGIITVTFRGALLPNIAYEDAAHAYGLAHGSSHVEFNSAQATVEGFVESLAGGGGQRTETFESRLCPSSANCVVSSNVAAVFTFPFTVSQTERTVLIDVKMDGSGFDGGGFSLDPLITYSFDDPSLGLTFAGGSAFVSAAAIPEPGTHALFVIGIGALGLIGLRRKRKAAAGPTWDRTLPGIRCVPVQLPLWP